MIILLHDFTTPDAQHHIKHEDDSPTALRFPGTWHEA